MQKQIEFNLNERISGYDPITQIVVRGDIKEFIKRQLNFEFQTEVLNGQRGITIKQLDEFFAKFKKDAGDILISTLDYGTI